MKLKIKGYGTICYITMPRLIRAWLGFSSIELNFWACPFTGQVMTKHYTL